MAPDRGGGPLGARGLGGIALRSALTLDRHAELLRVSGKPDEAVALLGRFLSEVPSMLDEKLQRQNANHPTAPLYKRANSLLTRSKRRDEALSWAKLRFVTCDFEAGAIERSTAQLGSLWAEGGNSRRVQNLRRGPGGGQPAQPTARGAAACPG